MYLGYFAARFPVAIIAFANAAICQAVYARYFGELAAHQLTNSRP